MLSSERKTVEGSFTKKNKPETRIELATFRLRSECSTTKLYRHIINNGEIVIHKLHGAEVNKLDILNVI